MTVTTAFATSSPFHLHWSLYPLSYVARKTHSPIDIDGDIQKDVWTSVPWSEPFRDITGSPSTYIDDCDPPCSRQPARTQFKALYDDDYLYIAALLHASEDFPTVAKFTERNSPIYQLDSDFEVFIDTDGSNHNYKELELNAINTVWNLMLDKPYRNGGHEHSGRVAHQGEKDFYDVTDQTTATTIVSGRLNNFETHQGATWTVEIKWSFRDLMARTGSQQDSRVDSDGPSPTPRPGTLWRINFSRVELQGRINWTWQKQMVWDPKTGSFHGFVDMHLPDAWGYLQFDGSQDTNSGLKVEIGDPRLISNGQDYNSQEDGIMALPRQDRDPSWPAKLAAMNVYYALEDYFQQNGAYTNELALLKIHPGIVLIDDLAVTIELSCTGMEFLVRVIMKLQGITVTVRNDRLLQTASNSSIAMTRET